MEQHGEPEDGMGSGKEGNEIGASAKVQKWVGFKKFLKQMVKK